MFQAVGTVHSELQRRMLAAEGDALEKVEYWHQNGVRARQARRQPPLEFYVFVSYDANLKQI